MTEIVVTFRSHHRKAQCAPDPNYPNGIDVDLSRGAAATCSADLPYPAECCGVLVVRCKRCRYSTIITTAWRLDDPRTVKLPCAGRRGGIDV